MENKAFIDYFQIKLNILRDFTSWGVIMTTCKKCGTKAVNIGCRFTVEYCTGIDKLYLFDHIYGYTYKYCYRLEKHQYVYCWYIDGPPDYPKEMPEINEHLHIKCNICGFQWIQDTLDKLDSRP